jgi:hypothetical protein
MKTKQMRTRVQYFARGGNIKRMGPFDTEIEAWEALKTHDGEPISGATVWPERKTT